MVRSATACAWSLARVLASNGSLVVITRNQRIELKPQRDGSTTVVKVKPVKFPVGTRIEIGFGPAIPEDDERAALGERGEPHGARERPTPASRRRTGTTSPQFHELLSASGATPVRELVAQPRRLHGRQGRRDRRRGRAVPHGVQRRQPQAGRAGCWRWRGTTREQVTPKRLGAVGAELFPDRAYAYATASGTVTFGADLPAEIPFVVEAWAKESEDMRLLVCVNRTPVTGDIDAARDKRDIDLFGCGLSAHRRRGPEGQELHHPAQHHHALHADHVATARSRTSKPFLDEIQDAVAKAVRKARRPSAKGT